MKKLKFFNKRGVAIEMALVTMLVLFGLAMILLTVAELGSVLNKRILAEANERIDVSRIGDAFVRACKSGEDGFSGFNTGSYEDYLVAKENTSDAEVQRYALTVRSKENGKTLLCVVCNGSGKILSWTNHAPASAIEESTTTTPEETGT